MKNYHFKLGQQYRVISSEVYQFIEGKIYEVIKKAGSLVIQSESGSPYKEQELSVLGVILELIADPKEEQFNPTIELDFLINYIEQHELEENEIIAFLKGYKKGEEFIHENLK